MIDGMKLFKSKIRCVGITIEIDETYICKKIWSFLDLLTEAVWLV